MYILNITKAIQKMSINEIKDFILENYYKRIRFFKDSSHYSMKHLKTFFCSQTNRKNT